MTIRERTAGANSRQRNIFIDHGIDVNLSGRSQQRVNCCRCNKSDRDKTLSVNILDGVWNCFRCGWSGHLNSYSTTPLPVKPRVNNQNYRRNIEKISAALKPIKFNSPPAKYISHRLGAELKVFPGNLKYHSALPYFDDRRELVGTHPAMVAIIQSGDGSLVGLHRTYLTTDGRKAKLDNVKKLTSPVQKGAYKGAAVRLYKPGKILGVSEGIETALAVHIETGLPVWSTVCANWMKTIVIPQHVEEVYIFGDNDLSTTGQDAAHHLADRLYLQGFKVKIIIPEIVGDWLDVRGIKK